MRVNRRAVLLVTLVVVAVACGGDGDSAGTFAPTPTGAARTPAGFDDPFLNQVADADRPADEVVGTFVERLSSTYSNRDSYFDALMDLELRGALGAVVERAGRLDPPEAYATEFRLWVGSLDEQVALAGEMETAVAARDLDGVASAAARLRAELAGLLFEITASSPDFCRALAGGIQPGPREGRFVETTCVASEEMPGGRYGQQANLIARETAATVFPLIAAPFDLFEDDEQVAYLAEIQPIVEDEFAGARTSLAELSPPAELAGDHDAALTYLSAIADVARRITQAAEANDQQALRALFDESARPQAELRRSLSDGGRRIFGSLITDQ